MLNKIEVSPPRLQQRNCRVWEKAIDGCHGGDKFWNCNGVLCCACSYLSSNVDYKIWAATKNFHVGDIILFYNPQFHNVMRVTHPEYKSCNVTKPINALSTVNDTITITNHGHHFFLCGVPGHCQAGQKVDINVRANLMAASPSSSSSVSNSNPSTIVPGPSSNEAARVLNLNAGNLSLGVMVTLVYTIMFF